MAVAVEVVVLPFFSMAPIIAVREAKGDPNIKSDAGWLLYV